MKTLTDFKNYQIVAQGTEEEKVGKGQICTLQGWDYSKSQGKKRHDVITSTFEKVQSRGSQWEAILPQGHLEMSGDIFDCHNCRREVAPSI